MLLQKRRGVTILELMPRRIRSKMHMILRDIESLLYVNAPSREAYLDKSTLKDRMRRLNLSMHSESLNNNDCIETKTE